VAAGGGAKVPAAQGVQGAPREEEAAPAGQGAQVLLVFNSRPGGQPGGLKEKFSCYLGRGDRLRWR
jgi:hypothetical protein